MPNTETTKPIKEFENMGEITSDQYLLGIKNSSIGSGGKITFENMLASSVSADPNNAIAIGSDSKLFSGSALTLYSETTTYSAGQWVVDNQVMYSSLQDNNIGNPTSDTNYWSKVVFGGRNIGEIIPSTIPLTDSGLHLLDGSLINGAGAYGSFVNYIADLHNSGTATACFVNETDWQAEYAAHGVCGKFVYDSVNNTVRLPKYGNKVYTKSINSTVPVVGNGMTLGMTDGTNNYGIVNWSGTVDIHTGNYGDTVGATPSTGNGTNSVVGVTTDSTKSGVVADLSNITASLDGYYYIVISTAQKTPVEVDIDEVMTDLNDKANLSDFVDCEVVLTTYVNGTSGFRIWSDGYCIQQGTATSGSALTFLKEFADANYAITLSYSAKSSTGFTPSATGNWLACGYLKAGEY